MRILVLEDNQDRIEWFKRIYRNHELYITCNLVKARELCWEYEFDVMFLDHDLGENNLAAVEQEETGYGFVKWLTIEGIQKKAIYYIHSMNPTGANAMQNLLQDNGYYSLWLPYHLLILEDR